MIRFISLAIACTWPVLLGAVAIVGPGQFVLPCWFVLFGGIAVQSRFGLARRKPGVLGLQFGLFLTILVGGSLWPMKAMDRRLDLGGTVLMLGDLARLGHMELSPGVDPGAVVRLDRPDPKRKQLTAAIRDQTEYDAPKQVGTCGTGASILFGGYPIGRLYVRTNDVQPQAEAARLAEVIHFSHHLDGDERPVASFAVTPSSNRLRAVLRGDELIELDVTGEEIAPGFRLVVAECPSSNPDILLLIGSDAATGSLRTLRIDLAAQSSPGQPLVVIGDRRHPKVKAPHDAIVLGAFPGMCWLLESDGGSVWGWEWASNEMRCVAPAAEHPQLKNYRFLYCGYAEAGLGSDYFELQASAQPWSWDALPGASSFKDRDGDGWVDIVYYRAD